MKGMYGVLFVILLTLVVLHWPIEVRETVTAPVGGHWK